MSTPDELTLLPHGWDGYQGKPVTVSNAVVARDIARALQPLELERPQFVPGTDGDIQIEYHLPDRIIEIHIMEKPNDRS